MPIPVQIPPPLKFRNGWAVVAALEAAEYKRVDTKSEGHRWVYHNWGSDWAVLSFETPDRAVFLWHDHENSETYFGKGYAEYFGETETDLLAGAADWVAAHVEAVDFAEPWYGFVYWWDGAGWWRAEYDVPDGFAELTLLE